MTAKEQGLPELPGPIAKLKVYTVGGIRECWRQSVEQVFDASQMYAYAKTYAAALASDTGERGVAEAWDEGYRMGVNDERISEANIGIAGFDAKVEPARDNPYRRAALRAQPAGGGAEDFHDRLYGMKFSLFLDADGVTGDETKIDLTCGATIGDEALFHVTDGRVLTFATPPESGGQGEAVAWLEPHHLGAMRKRREEKEAGYIIVEVCDSETEDYCVPLYTHPPAQASGAVTEAMVEAACQSYSGEYVRANAVAKGLMQTNMRFAIDAALASDTGERGVDVQALIEAVLPGGCSCDPQRVADDIRDYFALRAQPAGGGESCRKCRAAMTGMCNDCAAKVDDDRGTTPNDREAVLAPLVEVLRRFESTMPTPFNARGESTMRIEHFVDLVHEAKQSLAALRAPSPAEQPSKGEGGAVVEIPEAGDANVEAVRAKLLARSRVGLAKYGVTTERGDLSLTDWLTHLQEELMDACVYIEAARLNELSGNSGQLPTPPAQAAESVQVAYNSGGILSKQVAEAVVDKARMDWLSENFVFADFDYGHDHESILGIQWPKGLAVSAGLRRNVDAAIAAMQAGEGKA